MSIEKRHRIVEAAFLLFSTRGYRRVNMKEVAEALGISRPGLYLYFKTKEEIFNAVVTHFATTRLEQLLQELKIMTGLEKQLKHAFEVWIVEVFELILSSPQSKEIADASFEFARQSLDDSYSRFTKLISAILTKHGVTKRKCGFSSERVARLLVTSARGFKIAAKTTEELRTMIHDLIKLTVLNYCD